MLPTVNRAIGLLKRWLLGTHQGAVKDHQLDAYLDEFVFRYNRRRSGSRGLLFWRVVCALVSTTTLSRSEILGRKEQLEAADTQTAADARRISHEVLRERNREAVRKSRAQKAASSGS